MKIDTNNIIGREIQTPPTGTAAQKTQTTHPANGSFFVQVDGTPATDAAPVEIDKDLIFEDSDIKDDVFLLARRGANLFPLQNLSILKAQMKNGKTVAAVLFASAYLAGRWEGDEITTATADGTPIDGGLLYIDTEQSPADTKKIRRRITKLFAIARNGGTKGDAGAGYTAADYAAAVDALKARLIVANVRAYNVDTRRKKVAAMLARFTGTRFVIIDGVKDICKDFNNIADVADTMDTLTNWALSYNVHILCILHENPSSDKARGHLGTELYNKATEIINVQQEKNDDGTKRNNFRVTWEAIRAGAGVEPVNFTRVNFGEIPADVPRFALPLEVPTADTKTGGKTGAKPVQKNKSKVIEQNF